MKRKLACFGLAFALAEWFAACVPSPVLVPAAALFVLLLFLYRRHDFKILLLGALCGLVWFTAFSFFSVLPAQKYAGRQMTCTVVVETDAESSYQTGFLRGTLRVIQCDGKNTGFSVACDAFPGAEPGECFTADFAFSALAHDAYRLSHLSDGVYLQAEYQGNYLAQPDSSGLRFTLYRLRRMLSNRLQQWMPEAEGELESAMLLGHKQALRDTTQNSFRAAGVSHLLAVSGLHVALLCGIFSMGRKRRFLRPLIVVRAGFVIFYMFLTGLPVSVMRAGLVFLLALAGDFFWQPVDLLTSTGAAAVLLGIQNAYAPCDLGFQLSFCAVLGVQASAALYNLELEHLPLPAGKISSRLWDWALKVLESVQTALLASFATLPILVANGMTASGVSLLTNLLVVWMLQPALLLGILVLFLSAAAPLAPVARMASLLLSLLLHIMIAITDWCANLPLAYVDLPTRYTLFVYGVLGLLALAFWSRRRMTWYPVAAAVCAIFAIILGAWAQKDVVRVSLVGATNNPCVVCMQNGEAVVLFRGGQSNLNALETYFAEHAQPDITLLVDLRQEPSELDFSDIPVLSAEMLPACQALSVLDELSLDLYHDSSGNLAVIKIGPYSLATMAGNIQLDHPVTADIFCAAGTLSESVPSDVILTAVRFPKWQPDAPNTRILFATDRSAVVIRPGHSLTFEEVEPLALQ